MAKKELPVNVILAMSQGNPDDQISRRIHHLYDEPVIDTGAYRHGFAVSDIVFVPAGLYTLVASTFEAGQVGDFFLHVSSSRQAHISQID